MRDCFGGAGQTCTSSERLYVHAAVADRFRAELLARMARLRLGWTRDGSVDVGSLVSPEQLDRVMAHVEDARARGARVLAGGRARPDVGPAFMEPTVLADVPDGARCRTEETFGPVVVLTEVGSDAEALAAMNDTEAGLMASVWSRDVSRARASRPGSAPGPSSSTRCTCSRGARSPRPSGAWAPAATAGATAARASTR